MAQEADGYTLSDTIEATQDLSVTNEVSEMSSCSQCCNNCCPEPADITINQQNLTLDGDSAFWQDEYFSYSDADSTTHRILTLDYVPYSSQSVQVALNSGVQRRGTDFVVSGQAIIMTVPLVSTDVVHIRYFSTTGAHIPLTYDTVGFMSSMVLGPTDAAPEGWCLCDGTTEYSITEYATLYAYLQAEGSDLVLSVADGNFILVDLRQTFQLGEQLMTIQAIIKA